jgi:site-specific recombinase XerD
LNRERLELRKIDRDEQHVPALMAEQVEKLVSESKCDEQALYVVAAAAGMRIAEILGLACTLSTIVAA